MRITEFGTENEKTFLLLPGTSCTWECNFDLLIKPLAEEYHVLCVNYTGFDGTTEIFDTQTADTKRIEKYVKLQFGGHLDAVYGSSMGGSFASLLVQRKQIYIDHVFIGSSDLDQASPFVAKLETVIVSIFLKRIAKDPDKALQKFSKVGEAKGMGMGEDDFKNSGVSEDYMQHMMKGFCNTLKKVDMRSVKNQFYSDLVTKLNDKISVSGTVIHVFHSKKMGDKYLKRYRQHYVHPDIMLMITGVGVISIWDGFRSDYNFWQFFLRFVLIFTIYKVYDMICFDWFLLCKFRFFQHYFPEVEPAYNGRKYGYNIKSQLLKLLVIFPAASALAAWICSLF